MSATKLDFEKRNQKIQSQHSEINFKLTDSVEGFSASFSEVNRVKFSLKPVGCFYWSVIMRDWFALRDEATCDQSRSTVFHLVSYWNWNVPQARFYSDESKQLVSSVLTMMTMMKM